MIEFGFADAKMPRRFGRASMPVGMSSMDWLPVRRREPVPATASAGQAAGLLLNCWIIRS